MNKDGTAEQGHPEREAYDSSVAHLAQVLAHRLRGLVAGIEGYTDLLTDTLDSSEQRELAMKILEGAARIESILADLQLYGEARLPAILPVTIDDLLRDLLAPLPDAAAGRIRIRISDEAKGVALQADPFLLRQALLMLIQNALEACTGRPEIRVESCRDERQVRFHVMNPGRIDLEHAEELVFVPFYTTKAQNLGVGLTMARRIAQLHDGTLELSANSPDDGTCFTLSLPQTQTAELR